MLYDIRFQHETKPFLLLGDHSMQVYLLRSQQYLGMFSQIGYVVDLQVEHPQRIYPHAVGKK